MSTLMQWFQKKQKEPAWFNPRVVPFRQCHDWQIDTIGAICRKDRMGHRGVIVRCTSVDKQEEWLMLDQQKRGVHGCSTHSLLIRDNDRVVVQAASALGYDTPGMKALGPSIHISEEALLQTEHAHHQDEFWHADFSANILQDGRMLWHHREEVCVRHSDNQIRLRSDFAFVQKRDLEGLITHGWVNAHLLQALGVVALAEAEETTVPEFLQNALRNQRTDEKVEIVPFLDSKGWWLQEDGMIRRRDGKYYEGIIVAAEDSEGITHETFILRSLEQQEKTNGVIALLIDSEGKVLVQRKQEPGYVSPGAQAITSTIQSSWENLRTKKIPFAEHLQQPASVQVKVPQAGKLFFGKVNEYRFVRPEKIQPLPQNYQWMTLGELRQVMLKGLLSEHLAQALGIVAVFNTLKK